MHVYILTYLRLEKQQQQQPTLIAVGRRNMHVYNLTYLRLKKKKKTTNKETNKQKDSCRWKKHACVQSDQPLA